ncbi:MAG: thermonuclease family protein [Candidatus Paceibacterota bacterium]
MCAVVVFTYSLLQKEQGNEAYQELEKVVVNFVYDGDTVQVKREDGSLQKVRLLGVDTPELDYEDKNHECMAFDASVFSREQVLHKEVSLYKDPLAKDKDQFNRILRHILMEDGELLEEKLLVNGLAQVYENENFERKEYFRELEQYARDRKIGIFSPACDNNGKLAKK